MEQAVYVPLNSGEAFVKSFFKLFEEADDLAITVTI